MHEAPDRVHVQLEEQGSSPGYRTLVGHARWAAATLREPLGDRPLLLHGEDRLLPVARAEALLVLGPDWLLAGYDAHSGGNGDPSWRSRYRRPQPGREVHQWVSLTQGGPALLEVDWEQQRSFQPLLVGEPEVHGRRGVLYTFRGEEGSNHVLSWPVDDGAASLQLLGRVDPSALVALAQGVQRQDPAHPPPRA